MSFTAVESSSDPERSNLQSTTIDETNLKELDDAILYVTSEIDQIRNGSLDEKLEEIASSPLPKDKFSNLLSRVIFPEPPHFNFSNLKKTERKTQIEEQEVETFSSQDTKSEVLVRKRGKAKKIVVGVKSNIETSVDGKNISEEDVVEEEEMEESPSKLRKRGNSSSTNSYNKGKQPQSAAAPAAITTPPVAPRGRGRSSSGSRSARRKDPPEPRRISKRMRTPRNRNDSDEE